MDATTPDTGSITSASSERASPTPTPVAAGSTATSATTAAASDDGLSSRLRPDSAYGDMSLGFLMEPEMQYGSDAQLISNLCAIADNLDAKGASDMTIWVSYIRRHLALAATSPAVLDALKSFSASQIAWITQSPAAREQSLQYSTAALSGLHQAIGRSSKDNADSILATAILLISQSRDWLSWSSLLGGLTSVTAAIESWSHESRYSDLVKLINEASASRKLLPQASPVSDMERGNVMKRIYMALQTLRGALAARPVELHWVHQFIDLVTRLQCTEPARTPEAEFNHLYVLRKWAFWLPVLLLQDGPLDMLKLATIAHLYAVALCLGPVYPTLLADLCGNLSAIPLMSVLGRIEALKAQTDFFDLAEVSTWMQFPQEVLATFDQTAPWSQARSQPMLQVPDISTYFTDDMNLPGNLSPAFTPATFEPTHTRASSTASAFLAVPANMSYSGEVGFSHNISQWGTFPSPAFPTQDGSGDGDLLLPEDEQCQPLSDTFGAYIQPCSVWT